MVTFLIRMYRREILCVSGVLLEATGCPWGSSYSLELVTCEVPLGQYYGSFSSAPPSRWPLQPEEITHTGRPLSPRYTKETGERDEPTTECRYTHISPQI